MCLVRLTAWFTDGLLEVFIPVIFPEFLQPAGSSGFQAFRRPDWRIKKYQQKLNIRTILVCCSNLGSLRQRTHSTDFPDKYTPHFGQFLNGFVLYVKYDRLVGVIFIIKQPWLTFYSNTFLIK